MICEARAQSPSSLDEESRKSALDTSVLSIPTPSEMFASLDKAGKPNWGDFYRQPLPTNMPDRVQMALALGGMIADGCIAVESQDSQQVKNTGRDIMALAKSLGLTGGVMARGSSIASFAENNEWNALKEEFDATETEIRRELFAMRDAHLVSLVSIGAWLRAVEVVSKAVLDNYTLERAMVLRQAALARLLRQRLEVTETEKTTDSALIRSTIAALKQMEEYVRCSPDEAPDAESVELLQRKAAELSAEISKRP